MESKSENVILFPGLKKVLEEDSLKALQEKRYVEALEKLNQLLSYHEYTYEIIIGKLICLMELGRHEEAQELCEDLIQHKDENYYHYVHIYLTILFQTSQYSLLMEQVEYEFERNNVPEMLHEQFKQLYDMSEQMKLDFTIENSSIIIDELFAAVNQDNHVEQWNIVEQLRSMKAQPVSQVLSLLTNEHIHPIIKTALLVWMKDKNYSDVVEIHKFSANMSVKPSELPYLKESKYFKEILQVMQDVEQNNPTLFQLLEQLLYRYIYVIYPFMPPDEDLIEIGQAIKNIGSQYLHLHTYQSEETNTKVQHYMKEIRICDSLYLSIIAE